jgi:hypothetical protein
VEVDLIVTTRFGAAPVKSTVVPQLSMVREAEAEALGEDGGAADAVAHAVRANKLATPRARMRE